MGKYIPSADGNRSVRVSVSSSPLRASKDSAQHSRRRDSVALSTQGIRFLPPSLTLTGRRAPDAQGLLTRENAREMCARLMRGE